MTTLRRVESVVWGLGLALLTLYGGVRAHGSWHRLGDLRGFAAARAALQVAAAPGAGTDRQPATPPIDFSLWSAQRVRAYEETLSQTAGVPLAVLRIAAIGLEVPLLDGVDDATLNRAVGRIPGTARIGEAGNLGIAGHRDGYFRGLKDVKRGDAIELETLSETQLFVVT